MDYKENRLKNRLVRVKRSAQERAVIFGACAHAEPVIVHTALRAERLLHAALIFLCPKPVPFSFLDAQICRQYNSRGLLNYEAVFQWTLPLKL
ncbi:hypothetical protein MHYP_G00069420 [Metynnis hypsauchen]